MLREFRAVRLLLLLSRPKVGFGPPHALGERVRGFRRPPFLFRVLAQLPGLGDERRGHRGVALHPLVCAAKLLPLLPGALLIQFTVGCIRLPRLPITVVRTTSSRLLRSWSTVALGHRSCIVIIADHLIHILILVHRILLLRERGP